MQITNIPKEKWELRLAAAIAIFTVFSVYEAFLRPLFKNIEEGTLPSSTLRLAVCAALAGVCFLIIRGEKFFETRPKISVKTRVVSLLLWLTFAALYFLCNVIFNWIDVVQLSIDKTISCFMVAVSAGLFEELLVRGLILSALMEAFKNSRHRLLIAGSLSAVIFGILHYLNLLFMPLSATNQQVFYATALGIVLAGLMLRYQRLWPLVLIHFGFDFQPFIIQSGSAENPWGFLLAVFVPTAVVGAIALYVMDKDMQIAGSRQTD